MKKPKKNPLQKINFEIHSAYGCDDDNDDEICYLVEDAYELFSKHGIRLSSNGEYGSLLIQAWVINPNTIPVLEELGFEHSEGREWKEDSPFLDKEIAL